MRAHPAEATYKNVNISAGARNLVGKKKHFENMAGKQKNKTKKNRKELRERR